MPSGRSLQKPLHWSQGFTNLYAMVGDTITSCATAKLLSLAVLLAQHAAQEQLRIACTAFNVLHASAGW